MQSLTSWAGHGRKKWKRKLGKEGIGSRMSDIAWIGDTRLTMARRLQTIPTSRILVATPIRTGQLDLPPELDGRNTLLCNYIDGLETQGRESVVGLVELEMRVRI